MYMIGGVTNKTSGTWILKLAGCGPQGPEGERRREQCQPPQLPRGVGSNPPLALVLAKFFPEWKENRHLSNLGWGMQTLLEETGKAFHYTLWLPALFGAWWFRDRLRAKPGAWVLVLLCLLHGLLLLRLAVVAGYVSERHTLTFVFCGLFWAVAELLELPGQLSAVGRFLHIAPAVVDWWGWRSPVQVLLLSALALSSLPESLKTLHAGRVGHKEAGLWIAAHADPSDQVLDPFCWAHFYAGRVFEEGIVHPPSPAHAAKTFVVLDKSNHHSRIPQLPEAEAVAKSGTPVFCWPSVTDALVLVYEVSK
jgi:hypothetical protein